jgi:MFS family permease
LPQIIFEFGYSRMRDLPLASPKKRAFYGWIVLTGAGLILFTGMGTYYFSYGVFLPILSNQFGWSKVEISLGFSICLLTAGLASPLVALSIRKFGVRANIIVGNMVLAIGLASMSLVRELWQVYLFFGGLVGLGAGFGTYIACLLLANNWFVRKRSLAIGIVVAASGLGGFIFPIITTKLISALGLDATWIALGGITLLVSLVVGIILIRNKPEDIGQLPDGVQYKINNSVS